MRKFGLMLALVFLAVSVAGAQTKITGVAQFAKPDPQHIIPVGDRPNHSLGVEQAKCTWTKPLEIAGSQSKDGVDTTISDISGNRVSQRGYHVSTMANGDKFHVRWQGSATMKEGAPESADGTWSFTGGTGKLKGIKGKGTYKCTAAGESQTCDIEGEYQLPK